MWDVRRNCNGCCDPKTRLNALDQLNCFNAFKLRSSCSHRFTMSVQKQSNAQKGDDCTEHGRHSTHFFEPTCEESQKRIRKCRTEIMPCPVHRQQPSCKL